MGVWRRDFPEEVKLEQGANYLKGGQRSCQGPEARPWNGRWALWAAGSLEFNSAGGGRGILKDFCALGRARCLHLVVPLSAKCRN